MKRILVSIAMIAVVGAIVVGGTTAFFSDTETSSGNTFTAGTIDLQIDNSSYYNGEYNEETSWQLADLDDGQGPYDGRYLFFNFDDLKPGDWGEDTISLHVNNNDSWLCADVTLTSNDENNVTEPESKLEDNDESGELAQEVWFVWWADDGDNVLEDDEIPFDPVNLGQAPLGQAVSVPLADSNGNIWDGQGPLPGDSVRYIAKAWCFGDLELNPVPAGDNNNPTIDPGILCDGAPVGNISQSDSATLDVAFSSVQSRNNNDFVCGGEEEPTVVTASGPFEGWNGPGELIWQAEGRFGNNGLSGDWEVGVGTNTQTANQDNTNNVWVSGTAVPFTVDYDGANATFTVNGNSATYAVGAITNTADLNIIAGKVSSGAGDSVELSDLKFDGNSISPASLTDTDNTNASYLVIDSEDLSGGFTITGMVEFNWTSATTAGSRPDFQVQVRD